MGVNGFIKIIRLAPRCITKRKFRYYHGHKIGIDASHTLYKFCKALTNTTHYKNKDGEVTAHLFACFFKSCSATRYAIMPFWVFDGPPPSIKRQTLLERKKIRDTAISKLSNDKLDDDEKSRLEKKSFTLTPKLIKEAKHLLSLMGLPYVDSPEEAEAQCAAFEKSNITNGISTEDWDALFFGCNKIYKNFSNKCDVIEIDRRILLEELKMTQEQLIDLAAILGNDYCDGIIGLKPTDAYDKFKHCDFNMDKFLKHIKKDDKYTIPKNFINQWNESTNYYLNAPVIKPEVDTILWDMPQFSELYKYLVQVKGMDESIIMPRINELKLMYSYYLKEKKLVTLSKIKRELRVPIDGDKYVTYVLNYMDQNSGMPVVS